MSGEDLDDELAQLREQTDTGDRVDTAAQEKADVDEGPTLLDAIDEELEAIEAGERQATVSVWDGDLAALVFALDREEHREERVRVASALANELDESPPDDPGKSDLLRLALKVGLREAPADVREAYRDVLQDRHAPSF